MVFPRFLAAKLKELARYFPAIVVSGARQSGKTFLVQRALPGSRIYDLLDASVYLALSRDPGLIAEEAGATVTPPSGLP